VYLDFIPTTTLDQLIANNTSAASSFPGWVNGVAKPAHVSNAPLGTQETFGHRCDWYDTNITNPDGTISKRTNTSHPDIGIRSYDPVYCALTVADMKRRHLAGALLDWYGPGSSEDKSLLVMRPEFEKQGMKFAICADKGIHGIDYSTASTDAQRTTALLTALAYARKTYFNSPMYLKDGGKFVILFFGFATGDFDWVKIRSVLADCKLIFRWEYQPKQYGDRPYADGYFGWTDISETWLANVKAKAPGKLIFGGLNGYFNNTDPKVCPWGVGQPKVINSRGGIRLQEQLAMWAKHPEVAYLSLNTWNDYPEGSALEPGLAPGYAPALAYTDPSLSWATLPAAFQGVNLYLSDDGKRLMPLMTPAPNGVDLRQFAISPGVWTFVIEAVGGPMVQNVIGSLPLTLSWK
jgi:hypothetical protein